MRRGPRRGDRERLVLERVVAMRAVTDPRWHLVLGIARAFGVPLSIMVRVDRAPGSPPR